VLKIRDLKELNELNVPNVPNMPFRQQKVTDLIDKEEKDLNQKI
jgi:hypothetical protein